MFRFKIFLVAAVLTFALPGFSPKAFCDDQDTIKIGAYLPMTGGVAAYGKMEWAGIQTANSMEPEALGKKISVVLLDTKSDQIESSNAVSLLIEMKVAGIIG
jgi:branched-chain amino acid transport system substrate-binding protein